MIDRRHLLFSAAATGLAASMPGAALASASSARRVFSVLRDGDQIGVHSLTAQRDGDRFEMKIEIDIRVRLLGITAYRYVHENNEVWVGGALSEQSTRTDDDGEDAFVNLRRSGDVLEIDGSGFSGTAPVDAVPTSYYARPFIERRPWISSQSGKLLEIGIAEARPRVFAVTGDLETNLGYDANGEWMECRFDAGGQPGAYEVLENDGAITALWRGV
ncbi:MAG: DUF6134 family protein [Pseudomonadota bacterium]